MFELAWPVLASVGLRSVLAPLQSGHGIGPCRRICGGANDISFEPVSFLHSFPRRSHCTSFFFKTVLLFLVMNKLIKEMDAGLATVDWANSDFCNGWFFFFVFFVFFRFFLAGQASWNWSRCRCRCRSAKRGRWPGSWRQQRLISR